MAACFQGVPMLRSLLCLSVLCLCSVVASAETSWIWGAKNNVAKQEVWFRTSFELKEVPAKAQLQAVETHAEVVPIAEAAGFAITVDDMIRVLMGF